MYHSQRTRQESSPLYSILESYELGKHQLNVPIAVIAINDKEEEEAAKAMIHPQEPIPFSSSLGSSITTTVNSDEAKQSQRRSCRFFFHQIVEGAVLKKGEPTYHNHNQKQSKKPLHERFALNGTGRIAFGSQGDVSEIYHSYGRQGLAVHPHDDNGQRNTNLSNHAHSPPKGFEEKLELEEIKFDQLTIHPSPTSSLVTTDSSAVMNLSPPQIPVSNENATKTTSTTRKKKNIELVVHEDHRSNKKQNISKKEHVTINSASQSLPTSSTTASVTVKTSATGTPNSTTIAGGNAKKPNPYGIGSSGNTVKSNPRQVGVGQTTGKAAAMARMAALGEQWADEEELPGFQMPISSSLGSAGQPTKDVMKEASKSLLRQQKLNIAKKK